MTGDAFTTTDLISTLASRDIKLWVENGALKFSAPPGVFDAQLRDAVVEHKQTLIDFLKEEGTRRDDEALPRMPPQAYPPLSLGEERLWFLYRYEGPSPVYNVVTTMHVPYRVDLAHHQGVVQALVERHENLRMHFAEHEGVPYRVVEAAPRVAVPLVDLSGLESSALRDEEVRRAIGQEEAHLFPLDAGPLLRSFLVRVCTDRHVLVFNIHHAATDAWSSGVFGRECMQLLTAIEEQRSVQLPPLPVTYSDFACWQRRQLHEGGFAKQLGFWEENLAGLAPLLDLPVDIPRPSIKRYEGRSVRCVLPSSILEDFTVLCRSHGATLFMGLLAVFKLMLSRYCGTPDIAVGTAVAGRRFAELSNLIGMFTNTVVIRTQVDQSDDFIALLAKVRVSTIASQSNQDVPFLKVVEKLVGERSLSYTPIYQVSLALNNAADRDLAALASLDKQYSDNDGVISTAIKDDLSLQFRQLADGLEFKLTYDVHLFSAPAACRMRGHFIHLLESVLSAPGRRLDALLLTDRAEADHLLALAGGPVAGNGSGQSLHTLFALRCEERPDAIAVQDGDIQLSYRCLAEIGQAYAGVLAAAGVRPLDRVGLCVGGVVEMVAGMLATLEVGAAYVPIDHSYPRRVIDHIVAKTEIEVVLTSLDEAPWSSDRVVSIPLDVRRGPEASQQPARVSSADLGPDQPAYVIFTSGSTGESKGVEVTHRNVVRLVQGADYVSLGCGDVFTQMSNHAFDAATFEVWGALTNGAKIVAVDRDVLLNPRLFPDHLRDHAVSSMFITVALFNHLTDTVPDALATVRTVIFGGDAANPNAVRRVFEEGKPPRLLNAYGPTENTTFSTWHEIRNLGDADRCPIGGPINGTTAYVVDSAGHLAPLGVVGELLVGGAGVALGYVSRPDLTAERFVPDPFSPYPGQRLYRTGDWVRRGADGAIEYIGRFDNQVKIRGFRVETGEVEEVLGQHPKVAEAVVVAAADSAGNLRLLAYLVTEADGDSAVPEVREFLRSRLPDYKHPASYKCLRQLPLTPNGKVDRAQLPAVSMHQPAAGGRAPRDELERKMAACWCELLGVDKVGAEENFFELGGHSLLAITLSARLRDRHGIELSTRDVFEHPTIASLAARVRETDRVRPPVLPPIAPASKRGKSTLSFMQQRLWFIEQMQGPSATYHMPLALRFDQTYSRGVIESALRRIVERHESLRTAIVEVNGVPLQRVSSHAVVEVEFAQIQGDVADEAQAVEQMIGESISRPFDLRVAPLMRALLVNLPSGEHVLAITIHHIVCDGWSLGVLMKEFGFLVDNPAGELDPLPLQYGDYAHWQKGWLEGEVLERQLAYWRERLSGAPPLLQLDCAKPRPPERRDAGRTKSVVIGAGLTSRMRSLALGEQCTLFMVMLAGLNVLLARHAGHGDMVVGTPIANRPLGELEPMVGYFANTIALRTQVRESDSFIALLKQVRGAALEAYAYQDTPFDLLVDSLNLERSLAYTPLVQVVFAQENFTAGGSGLPCGVSPITLRGDNRTAKFDLNLSFEDLGDSLRLYCEYNVDLFEDQAVEMLLSHYELVLERLSDAPEQSIGRMQPIACDLGHEAMSILNRHFPAPRDLRPLSSQFRDVVRRQPDAIALVGQHESLTYAGLDTASSDLAARLHATGEVGPETLVGICMNRTPNLVVAVLAIIKAGAAYVPIDTDLSSDRFDAVLSESNLGVVVVDATTAGLLEGKGVMLVRADEPASGTDLPGSDFSGEAESLAYVMYTSGSTGKPKGVEVTHGGISRLVRHALYLPFESGLRFILSSSTSFDLATLEIWGPLLNGGELVVLETPPTDFGEFTRLLRVHHVDTLWLTSSLFDAWVQHLDDDALPDLKYLLVGGDVVSAVSCTRAYGRLPGVRLINGYGPTENTTFSSWYDIPRGLPEAEAIPIGQSVPNSSCFVLDESLRVAPVGSPGMLYVGGCGLARGYAGSADLTARSFLPNPYSEEPGARMYCTGDRAILREDGVLMYAGRVDRQVKIRGFRVELGEIEAILRSCKEVVDAVVIAHTDSGGEKSLVAFVTPRIPGDDLSGLRSRLRDTIPGYLLPSTIIELEAMPVNASGKADRQLLAAQVSVHEGQREHVAARSETEKVLAAIWMSLLSVPNIGRNDRFFDLGGHSLLAAQACAQINTHFGIDLRVRSFYAADDLASLAASIDEAVDFEGLLESVDVDSLSEEQAERLLARMQQEA